MKSVFDKGTINQFIERIQCLEPDLPANWGEMNVSKMIKHCILADELYQNITPYKRVFMGKIIGRIALKLLVSNNRPIRHNQPTHKKLKTTGQQNIDSLKTKWINLLQNYEVLSNAENLSITHPFFGEMSQSQIGIAAYKHIDHHLNQFGV